MFLTGLGIAGYRSFGEELVQFEDFGKVNVFIGKNNSGKSNVIRFIDYLQYRVRGDRGPLLAKTVFDPVLDFHHGVTEKKVDFSFQVSSASPHTAKIFKEILKILSNFDTRIPQWKESIWFKYSRINGQNEIESCVDRSMGQIIQKYYNEEETNQISLKHFSRSAGSPTERADDIAKRISPLKRGNNFSVKYIRNFRQITTSGEGDLINGKGLIQALNQFKEPELGQEDQRSRFNKVKEFVRDILGKPHAQLEIPHTVNQILVFMDDKRLPLESLGTGIHQIILLAAAVTLYEGEIFCIEEPEIYLHPELQRKFFHYITENTNNQYFITTHSNIAIDCPNVRLYHLSLENGATTCRTAITTKDKNSILNDLGYKASDILQSNCVIWVEGPSDRIYLLYWLHSKYPDFIEGLHFSIMFYGGRLLSQLSAKDEEVSDFIRLNRINRFTAVLMDSDKRNASGEINETKKRIKMELEDSGGFSWVTQGREIENYLPIESIKNTFQRLYGKNLEFKKFTRYTRIVDFLKDKREIDKVKIASTIVKFNEPVFSIFDLDQKLTSLIGFIDKANLYEKQF